MASENYRNQVNGLRKIPNGKILSKEYKAIEEVSAAFDNLQARFKSRSYQISGVAGDYILLEFGAKLIPDMSYLHMT